MSPQEFTLLLFSVFISVTGQFLLKIGALKLGKVDAGNFVTHILNMYPGRLNPMAANLFFLTVIGDPLSPEAVNMAKIMTTVRARSGKVSAVSLLLYLERLTDSVDCLDAMCA